jgi:NADPH:quinone reductase-like Zn-dependent oxidoreductase/acyl carrier protein
VSAVDATTLSATVRLLDDEGRQLAVVDGLRLRRMAAGTLARWAGADERQWLHDVRWAPAPLTGSPACDTGGTWLVFADATGVSDAFGLERIAAGESVVSVRPAEGGTTPPGVLVVDPTQPAAYVDVLRSVGAPLRGVIYAWGLDAAGTAEGVSLERAKAAAAHLLFLTQALLRDGSVTPPPLVVVTRGAAPIETEVDVTQAPLAGLLRSVAREQPRFRYVTIDLDPREPGMSPLPIARELAGSQAEEDVAYRGAARFVRRLAATAPRAGVSSKDEGVAAAATLQIRERGVLDNLEVVPAVRRAPEAGEVEIEVRAAGLNFRDVLNALGMYPGDPGPLGSDCAGVVTRVGANVRHLRAGDEVVGLMTGCFGNFVTGPAALLEIKPAQLSFSAAVTVPNAFLTAHHALEQVGGMRRGQRVLIHAAAGGVGLAAVQLARAAGAEVFATAGSPRKRAFLQAMGVQHVMDSRALDFADEIAIQTAGAGVDLILNSISGPAIERSLQALAEGGTFLEIGKNGIWTAEEVARVRPDVRYRIVDLGEAIAADVTAIRQPFIDVLARLQSGALESLPTEEFPLCDAVSAFRHMAAARHIGKVVIVPGSPDPAAHSVEFACSAESTYVVTGGFGGLGLATAQWLAGRGARQLMLIGRRRPGREVSERIEALRAAGVEVLEEFGDVSSREFLATALARIAETGRPLRGVVHAAGVLADAPVQQVTAHQFADVWSPKVQGAWNLHSLTAGLPLDLFVMFSSMSAVLGAAGQACYTASNAFLDALAHARRQRGLAGISINWGPWSDVGMAAGLQERDRQRWAAQGIGRIAPDQGLRSLEHALGSDLPQISVLPVDWKRFLASSGEPTLPVLRAVAGELSAAAAPRPESFKDRLASADPQDQADLVLDFVRASIAAVLALDPLQLSETQGLTDIGMDSLMAVELSNRLSAGIARPLPTTLAFEYPTMQALASFVGELLGVDPRSSPPAAAHGSSAEVLDEVGGLSEDEVAASLAAELERAGY